VIVGQRLARAAVTESSEEGAGAWMERNCLAISWTGQLARVGTLLAPLVSSALTQTISAAA
jgi:hypothetical protein